MMDLRLKGLYGRGTVRGGSKHCPKHTILEKEESTRGDYQQSVAFEQNVLAASWCDGSIVTMVTNDDPSTTTTVPRRIGASNHQFPVPTFVHGDADTPYTCPQNTWTWRDNFHRFYLTKGLFSDRGNIDRSSTLANIKAEHQSNLITATRQPAEGTTRQQSTPNQQDITSQQHPPRQQSPPSKQSPPIEKTRSCGKVLIEHGKNDRHTQQILPD
ncbi:unnamed protein product [Phytophthora fragariaefolia]|uniref:Unnamed protein product n=1 Tax=Phytophthora fragariaefolia TaxID=1490495 RepID=A0A9W7CMV8_9STRA|nr:unnamed protein product [Phytophthora fragariaefolia]